MPRARAWSCSVGDSASEAATQPQRGGTYPRRSVLMRGMTLLIGSQARGERVRTFVAEAHDGPVDIEQAKTTPKSGRSPRFGQCRFLRTKLGLMRPPRCQALVSKGMLTPAGTSRGGRDR